MTAATAAVRRAQVGLCQAGRIKEVRQQQQSAVFMHMHM